MAITRIYQKNHGHRSNIMIFLLVWILGFASACQREPPVETLVGIWANPDGATICLDSKKRFKAASLPRTFFYPFGYERPEKTTGTGFWKLEKKGGFWEIRLSFREMNGSPTSYGMSLLLPWENPPSYLFVWIDEEGGARYKLFREKRM